MYPEIMVIPMREELTRAGVKEARTAAEVDAAVAQPGTTMVIVNSICGCAAGKMRPGVRMALQHTTKPEHAVTDMWLHFSGPDIDAVTVLTRSTKTMNVVRVTGDLRPLDLLHLSGKFGIPKVDPGAVMVPEK